MQWVALVSPICEASGEILDRLCIAQEALHVGLQTDVSTAISFIRWPLGLLVSIIIKTLKVIH